MNRYCIYIFIFFICSLKADLLTPENLDTLSKIHVLFEWEQEPLAIEYNLQISDTETFNQILLDTNIFNLIYIDKNYLDWENQYFWRVKPVFEDDNDWINTKSFFISNSISNNHENLNLEVEIYNESLIQDGMTLFSAWNEKWSMIFDKNGREIWNSIDNFIVDVDKNQQLYGFKYPYDPNDGYYGQNVPMKCNFDNNILKSYENYRLNRHDIKELNNGNFLILEENFELGPIPLGAWTDQFQNLGYEADGETLEINWKSQSIIELNEFEEEVWNWNFSDYFSTEEYDIDGGTWWAALQRTFYDWTHSNSIWFDKNNNIIYLSVRHLSKILKIDYPSGNIIWQIGLPEEFNVGTNNICSELGFSFQHDVRLLDNGHLLFFDNGNLSEFTRNTESPTSRILEVEVIDNSYCNIIFEYELPYYCSSMGSVQLLNNNNYLISSKGYIFEIDSNKNIIWNTYLDITDHYRAFRIPSINPEAFSIIFDSFENIHLGETKYPGILLSEDKNYISLTANNKSDITQDFYYHFSDNMDWFETISDTITIEANDSVTLTFEKNYIYPIYENNLTEVNFTINPIHHEYSKKEFNLYATPILNQVLEDFSIIKIFPNPFNSSTQIIFDVPYESDIKLQIYNLNGQLIETLANKTLAGGRHMLNWNAEKYASGAYFLKMNAENFNQTKKIILIK